MRSLVAAATKEKALDIKHKYDFKHLNHKYAPYDEDLTDLMERTGYRSLSPQSEIVWRSR